MGFTVEWSVNCWALINGRTLTKVQKLKELYPKAKLIGIDQYDNFVIMTNKDRFILEFPNNEEIFFATDLDLCRPDILLTTIYTLLLIGCPIIVHDKITKKDIIKKDLIEHASQNLKDAGNNIDKKVFKKALKIYYGGK